MMEKETPVTADTSGLPTNGHSRPTPISSNATLFWRVFLPAFGTVFLAGLTAATLLTDEEELYLPYSALWLRIPALLLLLGWLWFVRRQLWPIKRVDADDAHLYVTNYWTTARYSWEDVVKIDVQKRWGRRVAKLYLKAPGRFGEAIDFLPGSHYREWMEEHKKTHLIPEMAN